MLTKWGVGYLDLTIEPSDPGKTYRVFVPGWHEGMEQPYVEEVIYHRPDAWQSTLEDLQAWAESELAFIRYKHRVDGELLQGSALNAQVMIRSMA